MNAGNDDQILKMAELIFELRQKCCLKDMYFVTSEGISSGDYNCLMQFVDTRAYGMKELSGKLGITPGGVTRIIAGLEEQGLVERRISLQDRRNIDVILTDKGKKTIAQIKRSSVKMHREIIDRIEPAKRKEVIAAVEHLVFALTDWLDSREES